LISLVGVITACAGFVYTIDIVYGRLRHDIPFTGWAPIMILILVIGGVLMLMLGIIGEYVWRIYDEVRGKPNYVVRNIF
jgi:dolichol-phosphate mannosyltransferase